MKNMLNEFQIGKIADTVNESAISSVEMKEDLIDHLCCIVEDEMSKGKDFETAYQAAFKRISPNGLDEIQNETVFLFTSKSRKRLDRTLYVSGFIALTGVLASVVMKTLGIPGGGITLFASFLVAIFVFFPAVFIRLFRDVSGKKSIYFYFGFVGTMSLVISAFLYVMHWPGASLFMFLAITLVYIALFPLFFVKILKKSR